MDEETIQENVTDEVTEGAGETAETTSEDFEAKYKELVAERDSLAAERDKERELARRHQSEADRAKEFERKWQKRAKSLERTVDRLKDQFGDDPDLAYRLEHEFNKGELEYHRERENESTEAQQKKMQEEFQREAFKILNILGVEPNDPGLAGAVNNPRNVDDAIAQFTKRAREIANGGSKVSKEEKKEDNSKESLMKEIRDMIRKEMGLDSSDTIPPAGTSGGGREPTLEELQNSTPEKTSKKVKSGEWKLRGWQK